MFYEIWAWIAVVLGVAMCAVIIYFLLAATATTAARKRRRASTSTRTATGRTRPETSRVPPTGIEPVLQP